MKTPNVDVMLDVMAACDTAGEVIARGIAASNPQMPLAEIVAFVSTELFYAAQDATRACALGVKLGRA